MTICIFTQLMIFFCYTDLVYLTIPNIIVLPAIILGGILTGHWLTIILMFGLGAILFQENKLCGGDVKLLAMVGAFLGIKGLLAFVLSKVFIYLYRRIRKETEAIPYAPFIGLACVPFLFL